jgi:hypothetical protein
MAWGIDKATLETLLAFGLCGLAWVPWGLFWNLFKDAEDEAEKRKKSGIGLLKLEFVEQDHAGEGARNYTSIR